MNQVNMAGNRLLSIWGTAAFSISKVLTVIIIVLITAFLLSTSVTLAQATWGSDQLIEDNAGYNGVSPQVAISGSTAVSVWQQWDGSATRISTATMER